MTVEPATFGMGRLMQAYHEVGKMPSQVSVFSKREEALKLAGFLVLAGLTVAALMTGFEIAKQILFPHITIWRSHVSTIGFTTAVSTAASYFLLRRLVRTNQNLQTALDEIKTLRGTLLICSYCKKIETNPETWVEVENYVRQHSDAAFNHGVCPDCLRKQMRRVA